MDELIQNVFGGIFIAATVAGIWALIAMLIHAFMIECMDARDDIAAPAAILSGITVIAGGVIGGVLTYIH